MKNNNKVYTEAKTAFENLFDSLNKMCEEAQVEDALKDVLACQHRTLQQNFMKHVIIVAVKEFAEKRANKMYDGRNEASCELAEKIMPVIKDAWLPFI